MLFTDAPFVTAEQLSIIDGEFQRVADAEQIVVDNTDPQSVLIQSILGAGSYFTARFQNYSGYLISVGVNSNHVAAVLNILSTAINRPRALLRQIPVIEPDMTRSAFQRWVKYRCLHDFYRACFARKVNDRYEKKMNFYGEETKRHWDTLEGNGFPIVLNPLSAPAAYYEPGVGTWNASNLSAVSGGTQPAAANYEVVVTYVSMTTNSAAYVSPLMQNGAESAGSPKATVSTTAAQVIAINITSLNPPNGLMQNAIGTASGYFAPMAATHWNVYVRQVPISVGIHPLYLQNSVPIPIATKTYTLANAPVLSGYELNAGQPAQYDFTAQNMLWRA